MLRSLALAVLLAVMCFTGSALQTCNFIAPAQTTSVLPYFEECVMANTHRFGEKHAFWQKLERVLESKTEISIMVVGGSEAAGVACAERGSNYTYERKTCAWSTRLARLLGQIFPGKRFIVTNLAAGGTTISVGLPVLGTWLASEPDILLVDFTVNDCLEAQTSRTYPILSLYEAWTLKARALGYGSKTAFVVSAALEKCHGLRDIIEDTAGLHGVYVFNFFDVAACASAAAGRNVTLLYWDGEVHPSWHTHQAMADMMALGFSAKLCTPPVLAPPALSFINASIIAALDFCSTPTSVYNAFDPPANGAGISSVDWPLREDRADKPGWIAGGPNSSISFVVTFGSAPRLTLTWLRSYEKLGNADMNLNGRAIRLPGLYMREDAEGEGVAVSQSFMQTFQVARREFQAIAGVTKGVTTSLIGFNVTSNSTHVLTFTTSADTVVNGSVVNGTVVDGSSKFKIILVSTC